MSITIITNGETVDFDEIFSGNGEWVEFGGLSYEPFVFSGGYQDVFSGGKTDYADIYAGAYQYNYGSAYSDYVYGVAYTETGAVDSSSYVESGGTQYVYGTADYDTTERYGYQYVENGGFAYGTTNYGGQIVYGTAEDAFDEKWRLPRRHVGRDRLLHIRVFGWCPICV